MALDMYAIGYTDSLYQAMVRVAGNKVFGLGEVATMPTPAQLARYPRYAFVMGWSDLVFEKNPEQLLCELFHAPNVLNREAMPGWDSGSPSSTSSEIAGL